MEISGSALFVKALKEEGVDTVFAYPGGNNTDLLDELYKNPDIRVILPRHEQALIHEAEGYAQVSGKPGVCLVTSGPGATNTVTGIADSHYDSVPLVVFTGQVSRPLIGNDAFQEVDIIGMTRQIVKFGSTVREREKLAERIKMAFHIANTGKKGPVILDIPKDVQTEMGPSDYPKEIHMRSYRPPEGVHVGQLKKAFSLLQSAKMPLILSGHGVMMSGAEDILKAFAETMKIPVVTTILGNGAIPVDSPSFVGNAGMHGRFAANMAITHCDVLFSIGTRFNDRITGELSDFAKNAKIIHVDVDTASISRNVVVDIPVVADAKTALEKLLEWAKEPEGDSLKELSDWRNTIDSWEKEHPLSLSVNEGVDPKKIMEGIDEVFPDCIVTLDVGQHQMWATQFLPVKRERPVISSGGLGTMGFGFPAAIGAKAACPEKKVLAITGDGGFQMNMQEMATAVASRLPVTVIILNNGYLGMVRQMQEFFYEKRYEATCLTDDNGRYIPDFVKWAQSYGVSAIRVEDGSDIKGALQKARDSKEPMVIEFMIPSEINVLPMVKSGTPIDQMILE